eukprot:gene1055-7566_t
MKCNEAEIDRMAAGADALRGRTVDRSSPKRPKYFFGWGYTYRGTERRKRGEPSQMREGEELLHDDVEPIPEWVRRLVIAPAAAAGLVPSEEW